MFAENGYCCSIQFEACVSKWNCREYVMCNGDADDDAREQFYG